MNLFAVVPAQYQTQARLLLYVFYKTMNINDPLDSIFCDGASSTGKNPPTHYVYCRKVDESFVEKQLVDQRRSHRSCKWAFTEIPKDKETALNNFSFLLMSKKEGLAFLGLKEIV